MAQNEAVEIATEAIRATSGLTEPTDVQRIHADAAVAALADAGLLRPDPDPLRELAERLADRYGMRVTGRVAAEALDDAIARARVALGRTEEEET